MPKSSAKEWYAAGLHFECTQCGNCCTGTPGYVWFDAAELKAMAQFVGVMPVEFVQKYARLVDGYYTLNETRTERGHDCVFLRFDDAGKALCSIYPVRPVQCRTWPFWPDNLRSKAAWARSAERCPGMAKGGLHGEGNFVPIEKVRIQRDATPQ